MSHCKGKALQVKCACQIYEGSICHHLTVYEKHGKEANGKERKGGAMPRYLLVVSFCDFFQ